MNLAAYAHSGFDIRGPNGARQTHIRVIRDTNGIVDIIVGNRTDHWTKNFLASDSHIVADVRQQCRLDEIPRLQFSGSFTSGDKTSTLIQTGLNVGLHALEVALVNHGAQLCCRISRVAQLHALICRCERRHVLFITRARDQNTSLRRTGLTAVDHRGICQRRHDCVGISIGTDDRRRFATELQRCPFDL